MLWINEEEMVDPLDELKSSRLVAGKNFPNFEMLDAKIASALNKIIPNSHFKKKVSLEEKKAQKEGRFLRRRQIAFMIYNYLELLVLMIKFSTTLICSLLLLMTIMSKNPSDDVLERLCKLRIRESAQLNTQEIHRKSSTRKKWKYE